MGIKKNQEAWKEAKKRCQLNEAYLQMAKELGMTPKSLIKNIPTPEQKWKAPVKWWLRDLYEEKFGKVLTTKPTHNKIKAEKKRLEKEQIVSVDWSDLLVLKSRLNDKEIKVILRAADGIIAQGGRTLLAKILKGLREKKVLELELDRCPVYGYFKSETIDSITE